jgi:pimeloyl-ACP methyl ester carboxylesterase
VACNGFGGGSSDFVGFTTTRALAEARIPVFAGDHAGTATWGNDASITAVNDGVTWAGANLGLTTPLALLTISMGTMEALNWARQHLASVACAALIIPCVDAEDVRVNNRGGYASSITTAYTDLPGWTAARPTHNPVEYAAALASIPIRIWYATDDPICVPATITAFAAAHGNTTLTSLGAVGHIPVPDPSQVVDFISSHL